MSAPNRLESGVVVSHALSLVRQQSPILDEAGEYYNSFRITWRTAWAEILGIIDNFTTTHVF